MLQFYGEYFSQCWGVWKSWEFGSVWTHSASFSSAKQFMQDFNLFHFFFFFFHYRVKLFVQIFLVLQSTLFWCIFSNSAQTFLLELYWWMTYSLALKLFKTVKEVTWGRNFFRLWLNFFSALSVWKISVKHTLTTL